jgi:hypothetical protein
MGENHSNVMLSESEASAFSPTWRKADSSAEFTLSLDEGPHNDILTQSLCVGGKLQQ